jgi:hypothetical protein
MRVPRAEFIIHKMNRHFLRALAAPILTLAGLPLSAGTIPGAGFFSQVSLCDTNNTNCQTLAQSLLNSLSYSSTFTPNGHQVSVSSRGTVNYGRNGVFAQISNPSLDTFYSLYIQGEAWGDDLTIDAPGLTGTLGTLRVAVGVNGTGMGSERAGVVLIREDSFGNDTLHVSDTRFTSGGTVNTTFVFTGVPFHFGSPFFLEVSLSALDTIGSETLVTADFSRTATLDGLQPFDSNNNPVSKRNVQFCLGNRVRDKRRCSRTRNYGTDGDRRDPFVLRHSPPPSPALRLTVSSPGYRFTEGNVGLILTVSTLEQS